MLQCYDVAIVVTECHTSVSASWIISRTLEKYQVIETLELFVDLLSSAIRSDTAASAPLLGHSEKDHNRIQFAFRKACMQENR